MKKQGSKVQIEKMLSEAWMKHLDRELDPGDTMNQLNRMALVTSELAGRLASIIEDLEKTRKK